MASEASQLFMPNYVLADSPDLLRARMLEVNLRLGSQVTYQDIDQTSDGKWIAWYYEEAIIEVNQKVKGLNK